jgi:hypothetical protein
MHANLTATPKTLCQFVLTQLMISSENNIEECTPSLKENAFDLSYNENLGINLNATIIDSTHLNSQQNGPTRKCPKIKSCTNKRA